MVFNSKKDNIIRAIFLRLVHLEGKKVKNGVDTPEHLPWGKFAVLLRGDRSSIIVTDFEEKYYIVTIRGTIISRNLHLSKGDATWMHKIMTREIVPESA